MRHNPKDKNYEIIDNVCETIIKETIDHIYLAFTTCCVVRKILISFIS